jgi:adenylosuccinate synthase
VRHVFSHFGSGTLKGASTHLSKFFVCHPAAFLVEQRRLHKLGIRPRVTVDPSSPVTTIYDMLINRWVEDSRSDNRHGSVGVGFGETLERNQFPDYRLTVGDISDDFLGVDLENWAHAIRFEWLPYRLGQLGVDLERYRQLPLMKERTLCIEVAKDLLVFREQITLRSDDTLLDDADRLVMEGAQGLLIDQDYGTFPYVTRSNTGLKNVVAMLGNEPLTVHYVTRAYTTRHGAGPLPFELPQPPYLGIRDETNVAGDYQGPLRFSYLNLDDVGAVVRKDKANYLPAGSETYSVVTCLDQLPSDGFVILNSVVCPCDRDAIPQLVANAFGCGARSVA